MIRQFELVERVKSYDPSADEDALNRAYVFSMKAHGSQKRASGDPYFSHPVEVAGILTDFKLDTASIVTALLHDTVEDTVATLDEIETLFGREVARLVNGVTKLSQLELQSNDTRQAENFRKLVLATSDDIRVLLVKLADRLHNMRTLQFVKPTEKRRRIAAETMEIYVPLAERMGIQNVKEELEDLAFAEVNPDAKASIDARLAFLRQHGESLVPRIIGELDRVMAAAEVKASISGREKRPCSIWRKMQRKNVDFEQLSDIMAFRVAVETIPDCYRALGVIHTNYRVIPEQFDDYISTPKLNGYQSLHTTVIGPERRRIEIQIRTREMHEVAQFGVAAHWHYKQGTLPTEGRHYRWMRELLDILETASGPEEFLEHTKLEMFQDQVFCFTPKGDLIALPRGATPVDFAYAVHSEIGDTCVGTKINGRTVPLRTLLKNGDQVEIITSKDSAPSPAWEQMAVTGKAKARVRRFVRQRQRQEYLRLGKAILDQAYTAIGYRPADALVDRALDKLDVRTVSDLYVAIGRGVLTATQVLRTIAPQLLPATRATAEASAEAHGNGEAESGRHSIPIRGLIPGMAVHYSHCCHPLPGDRIVGIVTAGKGVAVHTLDCETLESFQDSPERWLDIAWDVAAAASETTHVGRLTVVASNKRGVLGGLATVIGNNLGNINNLKISNRTADFFEMVLDIEVADTRHLAEIMAALRATPAVTSVERTQR
jgi:GTP pyrophosphokinase